MAVLTHTIVISYRDDAGTISSTTFTYTDSDEINVEVSVPATTTNQQLNVAFPVANLKACELYSDTQNLTVKTNSTGSPQETISLVAGVGRIYTNDGKAGNPTIPFAGAITVMFLTNAAGAATNFKFRALYH